MHQTHILGIDPTDELHVLLHDFDDDTHCVSIYVRPRPHRSDQGEIELRSVMACDRLLVALTDARAKLVATKPLPHYEDIRAIELERGDQIEMPDGTVHVVHHTVINNGSVLVVTDDDETLSTHSDCRISRVRKLNVVPS